jgi:hypothetical protein
MSRKTIIVVTAYNRPDLLYELLDELTKYNFSEILVSVDCDAFGEIDIDIKTIADERFHQILWKFCSEKLGIGGNLVTVLNEVFQSYDNAIILEDDIRISGYTLESVIKMLDKRLPKKYLTIGLFGGLGYTPWLRIVFGRNRWRESDFFNPWGWAIQRESWKTYQQILDKKILETRLANSKKWNSKSEKHKKIWLNRFLDVVANPNFTWDYQMQALTYMQDSVHLMPVYRSTDNVGFGDIRSVHTKNTKPFWYRGKRFRGVVSTDILMLGLRHKFLMFLDSITFAGEFNWAKIRSKIISLKKFR